MKNTTPFVKYQGAGNDFVLLNLFEHPLEEALTKEQIVNICDRRFGVGADGLILLKPHAEYDFFMQFYNPDGSGSNFCGNGGRCIVAYAHRLGIIGQEASFLAMDGPHKALINPSSDWVALQMGEVASWKDVLNGCYMYTGTDHYVEIVDNLDEIDVVTQGRILRHHAEFQPNGANVNFIEGDLKQLKIITYERGVEDETLACGTGAIAAAIMMVKNAKQTGQSNIAIKAAGGNLEVRLKYDGKIFTDIWLCGPAKFVFKGQYDKLK